MTFFCIAMALLYAFCAENSVPVTDAIFGVRARTRAQPRTHSVIKVSKVTLAMLLTIVGFTAPTRGTSDSGALS